METDWWKSLAYASSLSAITPWAMAKNTSKLYKLSPITSKLLINGTVRLFPQQVAMRVLQFHTASAIKEHTSNVWLGFGIMGVFQGIVYGHATKHWSKVMGIAARPPLLTPLRGNYFAISRDMISQGIPYHAHTTSGMAVSSIFATIASQSLHNLQTMMQAENSLSYKTVIQKAVDTHGWKILWKGFEGRLTMMLFVNSINRIFINPRWKD